MPDIMTDEIDRAIQEIPRNRTAGEARVLMEILKEEEEKVREYLKTLYNKCIFKEEQC